MLAELGGRDRLVMTGLVTLGLLTVVAGVVPGRSTLEYVFNKDARDAALSWAGTIDQALGEPGSPHILDKDVQVLDPANLRDQFLANRRKTASVPAESKPKDDHVSRLDGFALLAADQTPLATAGDLLPTALTADSWWDSRPGGSVILWRGEDSRHGMRDWAHVGQSS